MNRLVAAGLIRQMRENRRVIVVSDRPRRAWQEVVDQLGPDDDVTVRRALGRERIDGAPGTLGRITFTTPQGLRGRTADVVYLDVATAQATDLDLLGSAGAAVACSGGEVLRP